MTAPPLIQMRPVDPNVESCNGDPALVDTGAVYCAATGEVLFNELRARDLYDRFGDFAVGYGIAHAWADGIQAATGLTLTGEQRALISDCLVGAWTASAIAAPDDFVGTTTTSPVHTARELLLSPGDLDEAIQTALLIGDGSLSDDRRGSAFEKIAYLRIGVLDGTARCFSEARTLAAAASGPTGLALPPAP
jgi:predicted metalloprotease